MEAMSKARSETIKGEEATVLKSPSSSSSSPASEEEEDAAEDIDIGLVSRVLMPKS